MSTTVNTFRKSLKSSRNWMRELCRHLSLNSLVQRSSDVERNDIGSGEAGDAQSKAMDSVITLPVHPLSLNFRSPDLETEFRTTTSRRYVPYIRITVFLSTSMIIWFAFFDWYYMSRAPEAYQLSLALRGFIMLPCAFWFFSFTFKENYLLHGSAAAAIVMFIINSCWAFPTLIGGPGALEYFSAAMIQTLLFGTFLLNIRFVHVFLMSWASLIVYWIFVWISDLPIDKKVFVTVELGVINQMLNFALYIIERLLRQSYYQQILIQSINAKRVDWLEMMTDFLRHELKNKIVGIRSTLELIQRKDKDDSTNDYVRRGLTNVETMSNILAHTSAATSIEASLSIEKRAKFDLNESISMIVDAFRDLHGKNTIIFVPSRDALIINGIDHRVGQLFENLLFNAIDHAEPNSAVQVVLSPDANMARISVINKGSMLPDRPTSLFQLFETQRKTEGADENHVGLGLYLVKLIVDAHDGTISCSNLADNSGVEFAVSLPRVASR